MEQNIHQTKKNLMNKLEKNRITLNDLNYYLKLNNAILFGNFLTTNTNIMDLAVEPKNIIGCSFKYNTIFHDITSDTITPYLNTYAYDGEKYDFLKKILNINTIILSKFEYTNTERAFLEKIELLKLQDSELIIYAYNYTGNLSFVEKLLNDTNYNFDRHIWYVDNPNEIFNKLLFDIVLKNNIELMKIVLNSRCIKTGYHYKIVEKAIDGNYDKMLDLLANDVVFGAICFRNIKSIKSKLYGIHVDTKMKNALNNVVSKYDMQ